MRRSVLVAITVAALPALGAPACRVTSGALTRPLIELYTSEGCNSCPPADRWLASSFPAPGQDSGAVPLAFHVDYWNRLGWVDRFASAQYTERQYAAMRANKASFVYTPQVLLQGRDFPAWRQGDNAAFDAAARSPARATLSLEATPSGNPIVVRAEAQVDEAALRSDAQLYVVYADSGLKSDVKAGENRGVRLAHDHVVRDLQRAGAPDAAGRIAARISIARPTEPGIAPMLVAFVQRNSNGDVLQTVTLPLDACGGS